MLKGLLYHETQLKRNEHELSTGLIEGWAKFGIFYFLFLFGVLTAEDLIITLFLLLRLVEDRFCCSFGLLASAIILLPIARPKEYISL